MGAKAQLGQLFATGLAILIGANGWAQIDPSIVQQPWLDQPHWAETYDDLYITETGHTKKTDLDTGIFWWDSSGRIKPQRAETQPKYVIGYTIFANSIESDDPRLNGMNWDIGLVVGAPVGTLAEDWDVSVLGGMGTANDGHWGDGRTLYGIGAVDAAHRIDDARRVNAGLYFNGNSPFLPDVPLPYVSYTHTVNEQLAYTIGAPRSSIVYRPIDLLRFECRYLYPVDLSARAELVLVEHVRLFAQYAQNTDAVHLDGTEHRRLFYDVRRVMGGVRWITKWFDASIGVGYTLDHQFRQGYDLRDTDKVADVSEVPFVALIVQGTF